MHRILGFLAIAAIFLYPVCAGAVLVGTGTLDMDASGPTQSMVFPDQSGTYYADYDATYTLLGEEYYTEIFCVEDALGSQSTQNYDFYTIDSSSDPFIEWDRYVEATWVANWFMNESSGSDTDKAIAQVAIWEIVLENDLDSNAYDLSDGNLQANNGYESEAQTLLDGAFTIALSDGSWDDYADDWLLAVSPTGGIVEGEDYQNYLVPNTPIPEPATMLLLGTGLIGFAGMGRRKLFKK